jgi:hypothetical protein
VTHHDPHDPHDQAAKVVIGTGERWMAVSRDGRSWIEAPIA